MLRCGRGRVYAIGRASHRPCRCRRLQRCIVCQAGEGQLPQTRSGSAQHVDEGAGTAHCAPEVFTERHSASFLPRPRHMQREAGSKGARRLLLAPDLPPSQSQNARNARQNHTRRLAQRASAPAIHVPAPVPNATSDNGCTPRSGSPATRQTQRHGAMSSKTLHRLLHLPSLLRLGVMSEQ